MLGIWKFGFLNDDCFTFREPLLAMKCLKVLNIDFHYKIGNAFINTFKNHYNCQFEIGPYKAKSQDREKMFTFGMNNLPVYGKV